MSGNWNKYGGLGLVAALLVVAVVLLNTWTGSAAVAPLAAGVDSSPVGVQPADPGGNRLGAVPALTVTETFTVSLPLVLDNWPPVPGAPVLNPISNADCNGDYTVSWNAVDLADSYTLQEDDADWISPTTPYAGPGTSWSATGKSAGTYYYRVRATNSWGGSSWSNVRAVTVCTPQCTVYVENDTGCRLCYEVVGTGIGRQCYSSSGEFLYGTFPAGNYKWSASACCGSASDTEYYAAGTFRHRFYCAAGMDLRSTR